jgi:hypothetical protein
VTKVTPPSLSIHWILRASVWACFVGHGIFGIRQKADWLVFYRPFGIPDEVALATMPLIGLVDITMGCLALLRPTRPVLIYTACWGVLTGLLRPLAGMSLFETLERAGNYGPSIALLLGASCAGLLARTEVYDVSQEQNYRRLRLVLVLTTCLLLIGHGGLAVSAKPMLIRHWQSIGLIGMDGSGAGLIRIVGGMEIGAALLLFTRPTRSLCLLIFGWKLGTEMLFLTSGDPVWEVLERGGSYGAPLALFVLLQYRTAHVRQGGTWKRPDQLTPTPVAPA